MVHCVEYILILCKGKQWILNVAVSTGGINGLHTSKSKVLWRGVCAKMNISISLKCLMTICVPESWKDDLLEDMEGRSKKRRVKWQLLLKGQWVENISRGTLLSSKILLFGSKLY